MIYRLTIPGSIDDVTELRVLEWHAKPGQAVLQDAMLVELETHKVILEVRAGRPSFLRQVICEEGVWQKVGGVLALLSDSLEDPLPDSVSDLTEYSAILEIV